ncbi:unnamed protein product, partial [Lasius platythorax]
VLITIIPQEEKSSQTTKLRRTTMTIEKILESIVELEDYIKSGVEEGARETTWRRLNNVPNTKRH